MGREIRDRAGRAETAAPPDYIRFTLERSFEPRVQIQLDLDRARLRVASWCWLAPSGEDAAVTVVETAFIDRIRGLAASLGSRTARDQESLGLDGSTWTIEVCMAGECRSRRLWLPRSGPEYELGRQLFERAARLIPLGELY
ncbi:hypothetical protein [Microbulbifer yueqingensis]|uniref:Uncharacterized protein n=1 Tax=Microbulbifer yueqingensis TaxID=658219 RepID=A0A1G8UNB6_9GAMM|nr:hypothetical protein [Microbulbifer yueqingensis]SDJ55318.1 hypothetical protein SAMN05216212_0204 [Microbulbifer yueqingensis]